MSQIIKMPRKQQKLTIDLEETVLGGLLENNPAIPEVADMLAIEDFSKPQYRDMFAGILELYANGRPVELFTLADLLESRPGNGVTLQLIAQILEETATGVNVVEHARILKRRVMEGRRLEAVARDDFELANELTNLIKRLESDNRDVKLLECYVRAADLDVVSFSRQWLIENFLEQGRVFEFFGKYKEGKTLAVIDMAANLSLGRPWAGKRTKQTLVIWVAGEAVEDVKLRIAAWRLRNSVISSMPFYIRTMPVYMTEQDGATQLATEVQSLKKQHPEFPILIILDTVARCMAPGADENSMQGIGAFINNLIDVVVRPLKNATAIGIHHSGHGNPDRGRGHSSFEAAVDGTFRVAMDKSSGQPVIAVTAGVSRSTPGDDALAFRIETQELPGSDNFGNPIEAPVLRHLTDYIAPEPATYLSQNEQIAVNILKGSGPLLAGDWRKAFQDALKTLNPTKKYDALRIAFSRAHKSLLEKGIIEENDSIVGLANGRTVL